MKNRCDPKSVPFSDETHSNKTFVLFFLVYGPNFAMYKYCVFSFISILVTIEDSNIIWRLT